MYVYIYTCIYINIYIVYTYICIYTYIYTHTHTCMYICVYIYVYMYIHTYIRFESVNRWPLLLSSETRLVNMNSSVFLVSSCKLSKTGVSKLRDCCSCKTAVSK